MFGLIWSVGASLPVEGRNAFDLLIKEITNVRTVYNTDRIIIGCTVGSICIIGLTLYVCVCILGTSFY